MSEVIVWVMAALLIGAALADSVWRLWRAASARRAAAAMPRQPAQPPPKPQPAAQRPRPRTEAAYVAPRPGACGLTQCRIMTPHSHVLDLCKRIRQDKAR